MKRQLSNNELIGGKKQRVVTQSSKTSALESTNKPRPPKLISVKPVQKVESEKSNSVSQPKPNINQPTQAQKINNTVSQATLPPNNTVNKLSNITTNQPLNITVSKPLPLPTIIQLTESPNSNITTNNINSSTLSIQSTSNRKQSQQSTIIPSTGVFTVSDNTGNLVNANDTTTTDDIFKFAEEMKFASIAGNMARQIEAFENPISSTGFLELPSIKTTSNTNLVIPRNQVIVESDDDDDKQNDSYEFFPEVSQRDNKHVDLTTPDSPSPPVITSASLLFGELYGLECGLTLTNTFNRNLRENVISPKNEDVMLKTNTEQISVEPKIKHTYQFTQEDSSKCEKYFYKLSTRYTLKNRELIAKEIVSNWKINRTNYIELFKNSSRISDFDFNNAYSVWKDHPTTFVKFLVGIGESLLSQIGTNITQDVSIQPQITKQIGNKTDLWFTEINNHRDSNITSFIQGYFIIFNRLVSEICNEFFGMKRNYSEMSSGNPIVKLQKLLKTDPSNASSELLNILSHIINSIIPNVIPDSAKYQYIGSNSNYDTSLLEEICNGKIFNEIPIQMTYRNMVNTLAHLSLVYINAIHALKSTFIETTKNMFTSFKNGNFIFFNQSNRTSKQSPKSKTWLG